MSLLAPPTASAVLALATTVHLALTSLRNHRRSNRGPVSSLAFVSLLMSGLPWLLPSGSGVILGLGIHAAWFLACEKFAPVAGPVGQPASIQPGPRTPTQSTSRPRGFVHTSVLAVIDEAPDIRTFRFARPDGFEFTPGQFLTIRMRADGEDLVRCYSLSSSPAARGYLDITVKRQGKVSGLLHSSLRPASVVPIKAPAGAFTYPVRDDRPLLLLAGGIGITPLLSMLRHATETEPARPVALFYSARREEHLAFRDEIATLARRHPQVRVTYAVTEGPAGAGVYPGRIDETLIRTVMPQVRDAIACICGPQPMIDGMRRLLAEMGVPQAQVRFERFEAVVAAAGADATERATAAGHSPTLESFDMRCVRSGRSVRVGRGQSVLDAAEAGGVAIESLCRAGVCGTCRTRVVEGEVACDSTALDEADRADGYVLACVARVAGPCTVDA
jgi:glycine betaine catabolism B